jgi:ATP-dependent DNA helicase RecG
MNIEFDARKFMNIAIEEMKKSVPEPRDDGKINPKVGAVLVFSDGSYKIAYRGELRNGDHAEYTLLERKCFNIKLENCILFTTLEPCVERNPPKKGCSRRIITARIKKVYVGMQDHDPTVAGEGIQRMENYGIKIIMFDRDYQKIIEKENRDYFKQAKQRAEEAKRKRNITILKQQIPDYDFAYLSEEALQKFIKEANLAFKINSPELKKYLVDIGAMELNNGIYRPTGAGNLLFGKNPRIKFKQAVLKAHVRRENDKIEQKDFNEPLVLIPDLIEDWLKKILPYSKDTSSFKRKDNPDFPINVLREAVINALTHTGITQLKEQNLFLK